MTKPVKLVLAMSAAAGGVAIVASFSKPEGAVWIQNWVLLITALVVYWYTVETGRLREETRRMVEEAKLSRLQADASGMVDAEIRLYDKARGVMSSSELERLRTYWIPGIQREILGREKLRGLLGLKKPATDGDASTHDDALFLIEKILIATPNRNWDKEVAWDVSLLARWVNDSTYGGDVEMALEECTFLIRLINGPCINTSRVARRNFKQYERITETLVCYLAIQKFVTGGADYGEIYLAHLDKIGAEPKDLIRKIRQALKPAGWQPPETT